MSRRESYTFAMSRDGQRIAVGDGPEVFVYRGPDGQPQYKHFCDGIVIGMRFCGPNLAVVLHDGGVVFFRAVDGRKVEEARVDGTVLGAFAAPDGAFGVVTADGPVFVGANGHQYSFPLRDLEAAAFGPDRGSIALADRHGTFTSMDANTGAPWGSLALGAPVGDIAWCYHGYWLVTQGSALLRIDGGATQILGRTDLPVPVGHLAVSQDGAIAAVVLAPDRVGIVELHGFRYCGDVVFRRAVHGVDFGVAATLGIGFDDGDANTVELISRRTIRTEPHPGRGRNNWNLDLAFDEAPVRGAVTLLKAGGQPIAEFHGYVGHYDSPDQGGGRNPMFTVGCIVTFLCFLACSGAISTVFALRYAGVF